MNLTFFLFRKGSVIVNFTMNYHAAPFLEVITIQNAIDKIGLIDNLVVQHMNVTTDDG